MGCGGCRWVLLGSPGSAGSSELVLSEGSASLSLLSWATRICCNASRSNFNLALAPAPGRLKQTRVHISRRYSLTLAHEYAECINVVFSARQHFEVLCSSLSSFSTSFLYVLSIHPSPPTPPSPHILSRKVPTEATHSFFISHHFNSLNLGVAMATRGAGM